MRAAPPLAACLAALAAGAAGCGGGGDGLPGGDPVLGRELVADAVEPSCGRCHTLADAGFEGETAPSLDELRPGYGRVLDAIRRGPGFMPSYEGQLDDEELEHVAAYVSGAASR